MHAKQYGVGLHERYLAVVTQERLAELEVLDQEADLGAARVRGPPTPTRKEHNCSMESGDLNSPMTLPIPRADSGELSAKVDVQVVVHNMIDLAHDNLKEKKFRNGISTVSITRVVWSGALFLVDLALKVLPWLHLGLGSRYPAELAYHPADMAELSNRSQLNIVQNLMAHPVEC